MEKTGVTHSNAQQVQTLLKYTYGIVPIVAGLDKFTSILTDWSQYISSGLAELIPFELGVFMSIVGVIEIVAGVLVLLKPRIGALVVMNWLVAIALTLIISRSYIDVAVRDLVMGVGGFCLFKLSETDKMV